MWRANLLERTDAGKDWKQKEKRAAEDEMVRQHDRLNGREVEQTHVEDRGYKTESRGWRTEEPGEL